MQRPVHPVIEGAYFRDLMAQPAALRATLEQLASDSRWSAAHDFITARPWRRVVLTGMGSSFHALHPLNLALVAAGLTPVMMETAELVHYGLALCDSATLVVLVSQSGRSAETLRLLDGNQRAAVLGITNTPDSPLAKRADLALLTQAGPEFSVSCKTYVTGMLALQWLAAVFAGHDESEACTRLQGIGEVVAGYLAAWRAHVEELEAALLGAQHLFLAGRGRSLAAVGTGALIIKESSHMHAEGMSSAAFRHGPLEMLQPGMSTFVFEGDEPTRALNHRLALQLEDADCSCEEIGTSSRLASLRLPEHDAAVRPILEILPVEMMTLALAAMAGREAGRFERASKVTDTE